jgi:hypothetical protein
MHHLKVRSSDENYLGFTQACGPPTFQASQITHHWLWYLARVALLTLEAFCSLGAAYNAPLVDSETLFPRLRARCMLDRCLWDIETHLRKSLRE